MKKNIFASELLDTILLKEYADLAEPLQDIYRHVAVLEATGGRVHRQLVLRLLELDVSMLSSFLRRLEGLVEEFEISPAEGIYGWETRHEIVASTIATYKFSDDRELGEFLEKVIESLNPTLYLELQLLRNLCSRDKGVGRVSNIQERRRLLELAVSIAPGERVPRHRLIACMLEMDDLDGAEMAIHEAEDVVSIDRPIQRYKVLLKLARAERTPGIMDEDRRAMLMEAHRLAVDGIRRFPDNKYAYTTLASVGLSIADRTGETEHLDAALEEMRKVSNQILDPDFEGRIRSFERKRRSFG